MGFLKGLVRRILGGAPKCEPVSLPPKHPAEVDLAPAVAETSTQEPSNDESGDGDRSFYLMDDGERIGIRVGINAKVEMSEMGTREKRVSIWAANDRYNELRDATKSFVFATRPIEITDPELAITRYREALQRLDEYEEFAKQHLQAIKDPRFMGDKDAIERLVVVLGSLGRHTEVISAVDEFLQKYPDRINFAASLHRTRSEAESFIKGTRKAKVKRKKIRPEPGNVDKNELSRILKNARRAKEAYGQYNEAVELCRSAKDLNQEYKVLGEIVKCGKFKGNYLLNYEKRFYEIETLFLEFEASEK